MGRADGGNRLVLGQAGDSTVGNRQACGRVGGLSQFSETSQGVPTELEGRLEIFLPPGEELSLWGSVRKK